jgi:hypothetical protein
MHRDLAPKNKKGSLRAGISSQNLKKRELKARPTRHYSLWSRALTITCS